MLAVQAAAVRTMIEQFGAVLGGEFRTRVQPSGVMGGTVRYILSLLPFGGI